MFVSPRTFSSFCFYVFFILFFSKLPKSINNSNRYINLVSLFLNSLIKTRLKRPVQHLAPDKVFDFLF